MNDRIVEWIDIFSEIIKKQFFHKPWTTIMIIFINLANFHVHRIK